MFKIDEKNSLLCLQIRLDFMTFTISGPSTLTSSVAKRLPKSGVITNADVATTTPAPLKSVANMGQCLTDTFSVTNPDGPSPPTICGVNTGEHSTLYFLIFLFKKCLFKSNQTLSQCTWKHLSAATTLRSSWETPPRGLASPQGPGPSR